MAKKKTKLAKVQKTTNTKKVVSVKKESSFKKYRWMLYGAFVGAAVSLYFIIS